MFFNISLCISLAHWFRCLACNPTSLSAFPMLLGIAPLRASYGLLSDSFLKMGTSLRV
jgi:hypothetical protein